MSDALNEDGRLFQSVELLRRLADGVGGCGSCAAALRAVELRVDLDNDGLLDLVHQRRMEMSIARIICC
jgi:hypothetical protein